MESRPNPSDDYTLALASALGDIAVIRTVVEGQAATEFRVHRVVLALSSTYFATLFTSGQWAEDKSDEVVELQYQDPSEFRDFLDFCYPNIHLCITETNVEGLLRTGDRYLCPSLQRDCVEFLTRTPTTYEILQLSYKYELEQLCRKSIDWCLRQPDTIWIHGFMTLDFALQSYMVHLLDVQERAKSGSSRSCPACRKYVCGLVAMVTIQPIPDPHHHGACLVEVLPKLHRLLPFSLKMIDQFRLPVSSRKRKSPHCESKNSD